MILDDEFRSICQWLVLVYNPSNFLSDWGKLQNPRSEDPVSGSKSKPNNF